MDKLELYLDLRQGTLHEERKDLLATLDTLIAEAQFFKTEIEAGRNYNPRLADRARRVDELAISIQSLTGIVHMLTHLQEPEE